MNPSKFMCCNASFVLALWAAPVSSQQIQYELVDTGVLQHSTLGTGIEMRIKPSQMPEGGLNGETLAQALPNICNHYAAAVIPYVLANTDIDQPEFIAVRVTEGNANFGRYLLQAYAIDNDRCGEALN